MDTSREPPRIQDYAMVGDGRSAALVSRSGSVDWLCWPHFDSPSLFAAVLDPHQGGCCRLAPTGPFQAEWRYIQDTPVLVTRFDTPGGTLVLTDWMPASDQPPAWPQPEHELLRCIRCTRGEVEVEVLYDPRPDFGRYRPRLQVVGGLGLRFQWHGHLFVIRGEVPVLPRPEGGASARFVLRQGERACFSLSASADGPAALPPLGDTVEEQLEATCRAWQNWVRRCTYQGPYREHVIRSALLLNMLTFAPSGAVVAAPTTSLPEKLGGTFNWDYRFCWVRDAAFTVRALFGLGYPEEAQIFASWLLRASWLSQPRMRVLYDIYGQVTEREHELWHLSGYAGSRPVRVGNAAASQLQLDAYGEVIDAVAQLARRGWRPDRDTQRMLCGFGRYVCQHWREPDEGIWEPRGGPRPHTHSRMLCWAALERLLELHAQGLLPRLEADKVARVREQIREDVERHGWNAHLRSYVQVQGGDEVDASLLLMSWYGFKQASSARMRSTHQRIKQRLGTPAGLLYRNEQSQPQGEGAFGICSFWESEYLARGGGSLEEAEEAFRRVLRQSNDVGLLAEEMEPTTGEALGNFPQALTHVGLISAALALEERRREQPLGEERG
jgi:GH15 family glucan-1,4-alpha-glucosidase